MFASAGPPNTLVLLGFSDKYFTMNKLLSICTIFLFCVQSLRAQNTPIFNQFYANPFQFNPAFIANNGYTEANLFYRKQWIGIENAPTTAAINFQAPVGRNVSLGFTSYSDKAILLSTTSVLGTFGYRARFGQNHHINFGLSAGLGFNNFDFAALEDTNDPALQNITQNNIFINGQFGISYQLKNLTLGFALPKLFSSRPNTNGENFSTVRFDEFRNKFGSASYTFKVKRVSIIPMAIYRALDNKQDQWEGVLITNIRELFWVGASYRTNYGLIGMIGVNLKGLLRVGYSYEHPTGDIGQVSNGSHEIYLGARFGKSNREEAILAEQNKIDTVVAQTRVALDTAQQEKVIAETVIPEKKDQPEINVTPIDIQEDKKESVAIYYVVMGVFRYPENAKQKNDQLRNGGLQTDILFEESKKLYYLHTFSSPNRDEALSELTKIKQQPKYSDAWLYTKSN